jgi:ubiquinone/menaquinone biosynthesis C-methylase UbiE
MQETVEKITSEIYDKDVISQGLQFQVDTYYEPKEISQQRRIKIVLKAINPQQGEKILDVGCGVGTFTFHCAKLKASAFGVDYSKASIETARILCDRYGVSENAKFIVANAFGLPIKDNSFDKIVAVDFIEHITLEEKEILLNQIQHMLKPGGACLIFTPNLIREKLGEIYWRIRQVLLGDKLPSNKLHLGLISRFQFELLLKKYKFNFEFSRQDITRPYLARLPIIRHFLALYLLWIIKKV